MIIIKKCIGCGNCKRVCFVDCINGEVKKCYNINYKRCIYCGVCILVCFVDVIIVGDNIFLFFRDLVIFNKIVII